MNAGRVISKTPEAPAEQPAASAPRQELRKLAVFGLAYFLAHEVAFLYPDAGKVLAAVWPAAGIGLGALLLLPRRLWPASLLTIFLTGVSANVLSGRPLLHSVGFMAANVLESLLCAEAMTRWCGEQIRFTRVKEIVALALCAVLVNACTALVGAGVASSTHLPFWDFWFTWWVADGLGLMLITPLLVTWAGFKVPRTGLSWLRGLEAAAFLALWCAVSWLAFQPETPPPPFTPQPYMLFALLAWGAMRFGLRVVGVSLALAAAIALTSAPVLQGPFLLGGETPTGRLLQAQIFLGALSLTGLLLAVLTTERRRAEKSLRASEARGRAVFEHASIAISQGDAEGRILDANPAFLKLWGYSLEELRGVRWIDLTHPEDRAESLGESQRLLAGEIDGFALEKRYVQKDGQLVWASVNVGSMRNASGRVEMLVLVAEDITPRKAAEQARAEREELFQAMFENNKTVLFLVDPETSAIIDANHAAAECYGYSREELRNLSIADINTLPPEQLRSIMAEVKHQGAEFRFVHRLKDGSLREVEVRTEPFVAGGRTLLLSTINDITDRLRAEDALRETEERLRLLIEVMDEGVVLTTPASTLKYVNPAFARLFGQEPAALEGWRYMDLLAPETAAGQPERLAARRKGSREPYEAKFLRTDGSGVLALVTPFPLFSREGEYQGSCAIIRDITQARAREMAEQLRRIRRNALLRLHEMPAASRQELLDFALEQVQALTMSPVGYIYAYDDTRRQFMLYSWSEGVMAQCAVQDKQIVYDLDATGLWGDAVRLREPVLLNDFAAADPRKKGYPEGHVPLSRFLTLPVIRAGRVVAVVGVANKTAPYDEEDVAQLRLFTDGLWSVLERQDAQAELNAVSERFHLAVRAGRIGLWDWDLVSGAMHCDAYMERSFGLSQHDLTGTPEDWLCRVHVEDRPRVREALEMARATGKRFEQSFRVARPDGAVVHQDSLAVTYQGPQDEPLRMVGVVIDVTRQRLAEEQVAESHRFLQTVIDTLPMPFACKDREGRYLLVNTAFAQLYGTTAEDILGRTMPEFAPPERAALHAAYDERLLSAPSSPPLEYETSYAPPGGSLRHWLVLKSHLPLTGGRKPGLAAITLDITERKRAEEALRQSEERFRDLFVDAPLPYQSMDEDGNLLLANDAWLATLGYQREEVIGKNFSEFLHPDWVAHFRKNFPVFKEIGLITGVEFTMRRKDGSTLLASFNGRVSRDEQGRFIRTHCTFQDITERRQAEEALRGAKAEAEAATLAKAQFLANMSHEIRTPLGGVIGAAQLLAKSRLSHDQRQLADMAVESGRALLSIVNDILDFSKIEAGRLDLRPAPFALRAGLEAVAAPFRLLAGQRGLSLALSIDPGVPDALVGDLGRLEQVLRNLLGNAVKFTETGSITLEVGPDQACPAPQGAACLRFIVRDTGIGIDPDFLPHLFESFSQADGSYGKRHGGTGLGLAISRSLMERMGGSLAVTSTVGAGSAFSFTLCLPLAGEGQRSAEEAASPSPAGAQTRQTRPLRVLLAEDNEIGRMLLERMLKDAGHTTVSVGNGREVLDALGREAFDLVLMDVQMPEVDGVSATQSIRQGQAGPQNVDIPIVALTAYAQDTDRQRFLAAGMDDYLPKPVEERELQAAIGRAMSLRASRQTVRRRAAKTSRPGTAAPVRDPAQAPRFDSDYLERSFGDRTDLLDDLLVQFQKISLPEIERNLRLALTTGDLAGALHVAHKAKGTFGTVGARRAALLAQAAEKAAGAGDSEVFRQRTEALLAEMAVLDEHLRLEHPWAGRKKT